MDATQIIVAVVAALATIYSASIKWSQRQVTRSQADSVAAHKIAADNMAALSNVIINMSKQLDVIDKRTETIRVQIAGLK